MAWSVTGNDAVLGSIRNNIDDGEKATAIPSSITTGEAPWVPDFCWKVRNLFALECLRHGVAGTTTLSLDADNGAGDSNGVGTFTVVLTTT